MKNFKAMKNSELEKAKGGDGGLVEIFVYTVLVSFLGKLIYDESQPSKRGVKG